ncbi:MAG TPA: 3-oxoacyl-[acyl-carrier-protein] reductase [Candidatus Aminicenantes bacterium]|nr:3-oxoacyl-[acyl-carrier-protein] reductase [Candidatus Aminicenantes bacterium]
MDFAGKVAVVTGASQGIGESIAQDLAEHRAEVIVIDLQKEKAEEVASTIREKNGKASTYIIDVSKSGQVDSTVEKIIERYGKIDFLVNNAGVTRDSLLMRMKEEDWDTVISVNLKGVYNFSRAVIRSMARNRFGRIVNISSVVGLMGNAGQSNYAASKAGVIGFTKSLAREVAARNVTVNAVAPGYVATSMTESLPESVKKNFIDIIPMKRFGKPKEVAQVVRFLLSDDAAYITGQVISINGGMLM